MLVWTGVATDTRVLRSASVLVGAGHDVHIVGRAVPADFVPPPGVTVSSVGRPPNAQTRSRRLSAPERAARWLLLPIHVQRRLRAWQQAALDVAAEHKADVVHAHDLSALPVGAELARRWDVPLVYDSHELWTERPREGLPAPWQRHADARTEAGLGAQARVVITVGDGVARELRRRYGWADVRVVRNSFDIDPAAPAAAAGRDAPAGLVYAGRLAAYRELEVVARASRDVDLPITLVGPADETWLGRFERGRTTIAPAESIDAVSARLATAGLALVTHSDRWLNHRLALPNKLFHAVAVGVPVVATDVGELGATVREHGIGTLYRAGDVASLTAAIDEARGRYPQLVAAVTAARRMLSSAADREALLRAYETILGAGRGPETGC
jgi:glycosyltransferase involved in cell wall biosynthesis